MTCVAHVAFFFIIYLLLFILFIIFILFYFIISFLNLISWPFFAWGNGAVIYLEGGSPEFWERKWPKFSIVPKYLAFLRSNSGQEKLEKESLRLL